MDKIIYFDISADVILLVLFISAFARKLIRGKTNIIFLHLIGISLLVSLLDTWGLFLDYSSDSAVEGAKYFAHTAYLLLHNFTTPIYLLYVIALTDTWHLVRKNGVLHFVLSFPILFITGLMVMNGFNHKIFYFAESGLYTRGEWFPVLYCSVGLYMVFGMYYIYRYRKSFNQTKLWALLSMIILMTLAAVLQLFMPSMVLEMFADAISLMIIFLVVQRPEDNMDMQTKLGNRVLYTQVARNSYRNHKPALVAFIFIANYRALWELLGFENVKILLEKISQTLQETEREVKVEAELFYMDMGHFAASFSGGQAEKAQKFANSMNRKMKEVFQVNGIEVHVEANICLIHSPEDCETAEDLFTFENEFDQAPFTGNVSYARALIQKDHSNIMRNINQIIERAFSENLFEVYYQPIYSVEESRFNSAEALLRLKDPDHGFISPELFIPAAEKSGAILRIGDFVLEEVCKFIASPDFQNLGVDYIEVNLSVAQCTQSNLAYEIIQTLRRYNVRADQINLEITETAATLSQGAFMKNLEDLHDAGISFSLDDYGTGYSNMQRVVSMPLHIVKLDKSFVDSQSDPKMQIVIRNTVNMIKDMDMKIVVEGVETKDMLDTFSQLRCEYIQGYYFSKPLPKGDFVEYIHKQMAQA